MVDATSVGVAKIAEPVARRSTATTEDYRGFAGVAVAFVTPIWRNSACVN